MQALRQFFEDVNVQNIADAGRDLAQQLLGQASAAGVVSGGRRRAVISGNHKFDFRLQFEARSEDSGLYQTGVLVASATAVYGGRVPPGTVLPLTCRWKRKVGERIVEIPGITEKVYHTSADDIGMDVICEAQIPGDPALGLALGRIGPFEIDPITRMNLENLISSGSTSFPARHVRDGDQQPRDLQIRVSQDQVKVHHPDNRGSGQEVVASYSADYPRVILHPTDVNKFKLELSGDPDKLYHFVALSRNSRDSIALVIRSFHARKYVATTYILSQLFQNPAAPGAPLTSVNANVTFDVFAVNKRMTAELNRSALQLEAIEKLLRTSAKEKELLQEQLHETIGSYTQAIEQLHTQIANARGGPTAAAQSHLHQARLEQKKLQLEISELKEKVEKERKKAPPVVKDSAHQALLQQRDKLQQEVQELRGRVEQLVTKQGGFQKRAELLRGEELRRLRADLDMLVSEREELQLHAVRADKERADLIDSFMYVKSCLDDMQLAQFSGPAASPEQERKLAEMKASQRQMTEERNRLANKVEALERDRERQKQGKEASIERVMAANARLLEERDKLEKEKARVSELYQRAMSAVGAVNQGTGGAASASGAGEGSQRELIEQLRLELEEKTGDLAKAKQEGDSLRNRLKRLALVG